MNKFLLCLITSLITFALGISAFICSNVIRAEQVESLNVMVQEPEPVQISLCQITDNPSNFDGQILNFKATTYVVYDGTIILSPLNCFCNSYNFPFAKLTADWGTYNSLRNLLDGGKRPLFKNDFKEVDIQVIGTGRLVYDKRGDEMYSVTPQSIKIISPLRKFEPKGSD